MLASKSRILSAVGNKEMYKMYYVPVSPQTAVHCLACRGRSSLGLFTLGIDLGQT